MCGRWRPSRARRAGGHPSSADLPYSGRRFERGADRPERWTAGRSNEMFLNEYAVGKNGDILPEGTGKLMKAGAKVRFSVHYHSSGKETPDRSRVAMQFYPKGYVAEVSPDLAADCARRRHAGHLPAGVVSRSDGYYRFDKPVHITAIQAHMHNLGKRMCVEAILPDQHHRAAQLRGWDFNWHKVYNYADDVSPLLSGGHGAAHDSVARQLGGEPGESRSAQLARLRSAHARRDGVCLDHLVEPDRRRLQGDGGRAHEAELQLGTNGRVGRAPHPAAVGTQRPNASRGVTPMTKRMTSVLALLIFVGLIGMTRQARKSRRARSSSTRARASSPRSKAG